MLLILHILSCSDAPPVENDKDPEDDTADSSDSASGPDPGSICPMVDAPRSAVASTCLAFDGPLEMEQVWAREVEVETAGVSIGPLRDTNGDHRITAADQPYVLQGGQFRLFAFDGRDGGLYWSTDRLLANHAAPAVVDLHGNGTVEVVAYTGALDWAPDEVLVLAGTSGENVDQGDPLGIAPSYVDSLAAADVDGDGIGEILNGRTIIGANGNRLVSGLHTDGVQPLAGFRSSYGVDLDADGVAEVLAGPTAYYGDGTVLWHNAELPDGYSLVADFDGDLEPEVLLVSGEESWGLDATNGEVEWGPVPLEGDCGGLPGPAAIEDLDGDGLPEYVIHCGTALAAYTWGGGVLWSTPFPIESNRSGGVAIADLDGDGVPEVALDSFRGIHVLAGPNGRVRWQLERSSLAMVETPAFADLDLDGTIEMVTVVSSDSAGGEVVAWRANPAGPGRRNVWNSHSYHISDINDDMSVPEVSEPYWLTTNSFRSAGLGERAPDIALSPQFVDMCELECAWGRVIFTATLANAGSEASPAGLEVVLTAGPGGPVLGTATTTEEVPPYSTGEALRFEIATADLGGQPPTLEVDPAAARLQCLTWPEDDVVSWPGGVCE